MKAGEKAGLLTPPSPLPEEAKRCIRKVLEEMTSSLPFRTSRQCQDLLRYIVLHSLSGEDESLRERVIGVEEKQSKFSGRLVLQFVEANYFNQRGDLVARAIGTCTRHERKADQGRQVVGPKVEVSLKKDQWHQRKTKGVEKRKTDMGTKKDCQLSERDGGVTRQLNLGRYQRPIHLLNRLSWGVHFHISFSAA